MAKVHLVLGGNRSGKSAYAQQLVESFGKKLAYIATAKIDDDEMALRVERHKAERDPLRWTTIEAKENLESVLKESEGFSAVLVDSLTLWISNLQHSSNIQEPEVAERANRLVLLASQLSIPVCFVSDEVGGGIIPSNKLARRFIDLLGQCNQSIAAGSDVVTWVVAGIPIRAKGEP